MIKPKLTILLQYLYDVICFIGIILFIPDIKGGAAYFIASILFLFLFPFLSNDERTNKIAFAIIHAFIAYIAWTSLITFRLTDLFMHKGMLNTDGSSSWDLVAFPLPLFLAILTLILDLKKRVLKKWYEPFYLITIILFLVIISIVDTSQDEFFSKSGNYRMEHNC